jgi:oxygen-independent coproporphyrinogen-3 oxidase
MPTLSLLDGPALRPADVPVGPVHGLYVHVPFCFHKCHYCDFYSITRQTPARMAAFVDRVLAEADLWAGRPVVPRNAFFGGGTPTLLPADEMVRLIDGLRQRFDLSHLDEFTVEANPATVTAEYCAALRAAGVNRLSFGAQSFDQRDLDLLERHHDPADVATSLALARAAGFARLNLDLIFAVPGQTLEGWRRTLATALSLGTDHLSCYALTYEPNTALAVRKRLGQFAAATDELELAMLHDTRDALAAAGFTAYEVSNFARPANEACRHNLNYWTGGNYLGLGPSAASHVDGTRWRNRPHLGEWEAAVDAGQLPAVDAERLTPRQRAGELAMLMLRLGDGLDLRFCTDRTGVDAAAAFGPTIERLARTGLIEPSAGPVRLTRRGIEVADAVAGEFVAAAAGLDGG